MRYFQYIKILSFLLCFCAVLSIASFKKGERWVEKVPAQYLKDYVLIHHIVINNFPSRKADGKKWDSASGLFEPDIYIEIKDQSGIVIWSHQKQPFNNALKGELTLRKDAVNLTLTDIRGSYMVSLYGDENFQSNELMDRIVFEPYTHTNQANIFTSAETEILQLL